MNDLSEFDFNDLQALLRFSHIKLPDSCFLLLNIKDADAAKQWFSSAPFSSAVKTDPLPDKALQIAFTVAGLRALGLREDIIQAFSDEFIIGMSGDESRSRRLGDIGVNAPDRWQWGGDAAQVPHLLLLLYAAKGGIDAWRKSISNKKFKTAFRVVKQLPTLDIGKIEPFGFTDGISQPNLDWARQQSADTHARDHYSNLLAIGEVVLGYPNEYNQYTVRPLIDPANDTLADLLLNAEDQPNLKDFGRNGSYLVLRQLDQDVPGFWQFLDKAAGSVPEQRERLAAAMVGRQRDGTPLEPPLNADIPGIPGSDDLNRFNYNADSAAYKCPLGAHIRRMNPRTGDLPPGGGDGWFNRLLKIFGFSRKQASDDLLASARFHRILRRGRAYGPVLTPEEAVKADAPAAERGLQFICLVGNICRQFEFVHNAWVMNSRFNGLQHERDPLLGIREPLSDGEPTDQFSRPDPSAPPQKVCGLPQFITVRGGAYFFMPGLRALKYLAALPSKGSE